MIVELAAENVAILDRAQMSLGPGFTVLTGETGAGKSLLIDAIELALGARGDSDLVRSGASRATVSLTVDLSSRPDLADRCLEMGFHPEDGLLYVQRELFAEGRSQGRIQGKMMPLSSLKALGQVLVDLHGQHDHQSLLHPEQHLAFLDAWIGVPAAQLVADVGEKWRTASDIERRLHAIRISRREREQRADLLRFQVDEIRAVDPKRGEFGELEGQLSRLQHAERLANTANEALEDLARKEGSALDVVGSNARALESAAELDPSLQAALDPMREAMYLLEEGIEQLRTYADAIEADPERLQDVADRLDALRRLRKKYGDDEDAILAHLAKAQEELAILEDDSEGESSLESRLAEARAALDHASSELTKLRRNASDRFADLVQSELRQLAMEKARFAVSFAEKAIDASGGDAVEFTFSANVGEPPRPLAKIASGGEIARLMLSMKTVLAGKAGVPTLIFDEVESGLGGPTAAVVGKKLEELSQHYQVIVISHLPQIAGRALTHFKIEKGESGGRVATKLRALDRDERVLEIARMLAGKTVGETALAHAKELIEGNA